MGQSLTNSRGGKSPKVECYHTMLTDPRTYAESSNLGVLARQVSGFGVKLIMFRTIGAGSLGGLLSAQWHGVG